MYNSLNESFDDNVDICYSYLRGRCTSGIHCKYTHPPMFELLTIDEENKSVNPCTFLFEPNGCAMCIPKNKQLRICEVDNNRNHFYNPKYVCEKFFYNSTCNGCKLLHIPWRNFERNMFRSYRDTNKSKSINFLISMIFKLVCKEEDKEFNNIIKTHNVILNTLKEQYCSKCINCGLIPHKPKLKNPKVFTCYVVSKLKIFEDVAKIIVSYMYNKHKDKCIFIKNVYSPDYLSKIQFMRLSNLSLYGDRCHPIYPPYYIILNENENSRFIQTINGPSIDYYNKEEQNEIWKVLTSDI